MLNVAVCLFTLTCSHRPIFICFVSVATFLVALDALICGLLFSKCSAKNLWLSSLNWALNRQYGLVAKPSGKSASNSINTSAFVGTDRTKCPQLPSRSSSTQRSTTNAGGLPHDEEGIQCNNLLYSGYLCCAVNKFFSPEDLMPLRKAI